MVMNTSRLMTRWRGVRQLLTLEPFDRSTLEGRTNERHRRAMLATLATIAARFATIAVAVVSIPLTLNFLGPERFGLWVTISSFQLLLVFADFGLGNGLVNLIAEADGAEDRLAIRKAVSNAFFLLVGVAVFGGVIAALIVPGVDWAQLFNARSPDAIAETGPAVAVFALCLLLNLPLGIVARVQIGLQEGFANGIWTVLGNLLALAGLVIAIRFGAGLPWLILALFGGPIVAAALNGLVLFGLRRPWARPVRGDADGAVVARLLRVGSMFFVLQLVMSVAYQTDVVVAASALGPTAAAEYAIAYRLFMVGPALVTMAVMTLWPAYGEAAIRHDFDWIRRSLRRSIRLAFGLSLAWCALVLLLHEPLLRLWIGTSIQPSFALLLGMSAWAIASTTFNAVGVLLNGISVMKFQVVVGVVMGVASIALSVFLAWRVGVAGIIWGTVIAYLLCSVLPTVFYVPRVLSSLGIPPARAADAR